MDRNRERPLAFQQKLCAAISGSDRNAEQPRQRVNLIIDIQSRLQGKGPGYERWAKVFNLKQMAIALAYLQENSLMEYEQLEKKHRKLWSASTFCTARLRTPRSFSEPIWN